MVQRKRNSGAVFEGHECLRARAQLRTSWPGRKLYRFFTVFTLFFLVKSLAQITKRDQT